MKTSLMLLLGVLAIPPAWALDANEVRGGWETTVNGTQRIYDFEIRGDRVTGVYCTDCADTTTLAFVEGTLLSDQMRFIVRHVRDDGSTAYQDQVTARIEDGHLVVSGRAGGPGGGISFHWVMHKDPRGPAGAGSTVSPVLPQPSAPARNAAAYGVRSQRPRAARAAGNGANFLNPAYQQPGPWEPITAARLVGVWYWASGTARQQFVIRKVGDQLLGMVCGPCDNPYTMAPLDDFIIHGDTLTFRIRHQDWGAGPLPYDHVITAHMTPNELRIVSAIADNQPPQQQPFAHLAFSLTGPVAPEATSPH
ncbi:MAG TPA: hypothetical protein VMF64_02340 [Steroidobacteraceae bacterium]|nr:hypothetical protein [Steroidobacteraceae bacterium]